MKLQLTSKNLHTAAAKTTDNRVINFTKTNSSWYDWNISGRNVGDEFEVPDEAIRTSGQGNTFIDRLNADKFSAALKIEAQFIGLEAMKTKIARDNAL